jgi:hypothetical protein
MGPSAGPALARELRRHPVGSALLHERLHALARLGRTLERANIAVSGAELSAGSRFHADGIFARLAATRGEELYALGRRTVMDRVTALPSEIGAAVVYFESDAAAFVTGPGPRSRRRDAPRLITIDQQRPVSIAGTTTEPAGTRRVYRFVRCRPAGFRVTSPRVANGICRRRSGAPMADQSDGKKDPVPAREASPPVDPLSPLATPEGVADNPWRRSANLDPELERLYQRIQSSSEPPASAPSGHANPYTSSDSGITSVIFRAQRQWGFDGGGGGGFAAPEAGATSPPPALPTGPAPGTAPPAAAGSTAFGAGAEQHHEPGWPAPLEAPTGVPGGVATDAAGSATEPLARGATDPAGWPGTGHGADDPGWSFTGPGGHTDWYPVPGFRLGLETMYTHIDSGFHGGGEQMAPSPTPGQPITPPLTPADPMPAPVDPPLVHPTPMDSTPMDPTPMAPEPSPADGVGLAPENQAPFTC